MDGIMEKGVENRNSGLVRPREFRYEVITKLDDIKACLRLRYMTYRYVNFIEENRDRLDIDPYDPYSTFLGAYDVSGNKKILVGTLRIISMNEKSPSHDNIQEIIRTARDPQIRNMDQRPELFPIMESFDLPESFQAYFHRDGNSQSEKNLYEISRLAVRPDYWMHEIDVGLHHLLILDSWQHRPSRNDFVIAVHPRARRRYNLVGFEMVPDTKEVMYKHIDQLAVAMFLDLEEYLNRPRSYRDTCQKLQPRYNSSSFFSRITDRRMIDRRIRERRKENILENQENAES